MTYGIEARTTQTVRFLSGHAEELQTDGDLPFLGARLTGVSHLAHETLCKAEAEGRHSCALHAPRRNARIWLKELLLSVSQGKRG